MTVDATGLTIKTVQEIVTDFETKQRSDIDPNIVTAPEEPLGQINGIVANSQREVWDLAQVAYNAFNPDAAEGFLLDAVSALTGTVRLRPTYSRVLCQCSLDNGTMLVPDQDFAHVDGQPQTRFTPIAEFTADADDNFFVEFVSEDLGPVVANAGTLTVIATPKTGWNSINNPEDATLGRNEETDTELRLRREERLSATGSGTPDAIRSAVLGVTGVDFCKVFENVTDDTDADGVPPHSFEVLVYDAIADAADDDAIAQAIWDNKPAGIRSYGTESGTAVDLAGDDHVISFSRAAAIEIWIDVTVTSDVTIDEDALAEHIVTELETNRKPGDDVIYNRVICAVIDFPDVIDVTSLAIGTSDPPGSTDNISIGTRSIALFDTSRIDITS